MVIACVNQKGGVGKTTLAVHLAVWLQHVGDTVALLDCDPQATASRWLARMSATMSTAVGQNVDDILEQATRLNQEHTFIIADGPASLAESTRALLLVADLAVVPCGPTLPELEASAATIRMLQTARLVRSGQQPDGLVVLTRLRHQRCRLVREAPQAAASLGLPVARSTLALREATADAPGQGRTIWELGRRGQTAAAEMTLLCQEIRNYAEHTTDNATDAEQRAAGLSGVHPTRGVGFCPATG